MNPAVMVQPILPFKKTNLLWSISSDDFMPFKLETWKLHMAASPRHRSPSQQAVVTRPRG